ncbi:hypothetical protein Mcate_01716 [Meiothermus taiwanensis]|jgi:hypothetical protein|uniref:Uncharacterized protein n=1 Tax=Meiothermus taiwanensis TaxID=172827 RepID=A0A399DZ23_9DEIN|nr:hypothetical protein Mcate_01716 [Meiothermus taiwanensis]
MASVTTDWVTLSEVRALEIEPDSATAMKYTNCLSDICTEASHR